MSTFKSADGYRAFYQDVSGNLTVAAGTDDTTLVTARNANSTIFIQRIIVWINTDAAQSMSFEDSNGTAKQIANIPANPGADTRWDFDYGDAGEPLTEGKNFVMNVSAPGLVAKVLWYGYTKITSPVAAGSTN